MVNCSERYYTCRYHYLGNLNHSMKPNTLLTFLVKAEECVVDCMDLIVDEINTVCPEVSELKQWKEEDHYAEKQCESDYGYCDHPIYVGYIEFKAPAKYRDSLEENGFYVKRR